jgi:hypothetical protein
MVLGTYHLTQGCLIFPDTIYQNGVTYTKLPLNSEARKYQECTYVEENIYFAEKRTWVLGLKVNRALVAPVVCT